MKAELFGLRAQWGNYKRLHRDACEREKALKEKVAELEARLRQRERELFAAKSERRRRRTRKAGESEATPGARPRRRGHQRGAPGHGRKDYAHLPVREEWVELAEGERCCPSCGLPFEVVGGSEDSEQVEVEVRAYRRRLRRRRYRPTCRCAGLPAVSAAPRPPKLIPKGRYGTSVWVSVLLDKYEFLRPTHRLVEDLKTHGLELSAGTVSCRLAMLRMQADGLLTLPPPRNGNGNRCPYRRRTPATDPGPPVTLPVHQLGPLQLHLVADRAESHLWNEYIARYHYLGYRPLPGAQLRYFARAEGRTLALLGFGAAAWRLAPRDRWIGWTDEQRARHLHLVVNNARFLILPWIESKNLASKLLALIARRLRHDWAARYGYRPLLLETFVDADRYSGHCYRAANWLHVGTTQGRGKLDRNHTARLPRKGIWLYPLAHDFRSHLCS